MWVSLIGTGCARLARLTADRAQAAMVLVIAVLLGGAGASQARAETLRWKLSPGEVLRYTMESKQVESFLVTGKEKKSTRTNTTNLSWQVKSVAANGDAEIVLRFDRVRMRVEQPPLMPIEFDSAPSKLKIPDELESVDRQIKALAGAELNFRMRPTGEVDNLKVPEPTLKKLREGIPKNAPDADAASEKALTSLLMSSKPPSFPAESLEPGKTWTSAPSKITTPIGTLSMDQIFTFQGPDPKNPKLMVVGVVAKVALQPAENVAAKIRKQEGAGSLSFDSEAGRIVNSRNKEKMEMIITDRGQDIIQSTDTTTTMTLEP